MARVARVCGNCGSKQGPFDRLFVGDRKTGRWVFTCPIDRTLPDDKKRERAEACTARRYKKDGTATKADAAGSGELPEPVGEQGVAG